jgi:polysaccharide export outer membrane protein
MLWGLVGCGAPAQVTPGAPHETSDAIVDLTSATPIPPERFPSPGPSTVAPGDILDLRVLGFPELTGNFLVAYDGRINLSLIGSVQAAGRTADELDRDLTTAYSTYYRNIDIAVNVSTRTERFVYVIGEVLRPGRMDFRPGDRVVHAIALGGGMTASARENTVILLRTEADGKDHCYALDFSQFYRKMPPQDVHLQPGDVVFVPKNRLRTVTEVGTAIMDVVGRAALTALVIDDLQSRTRALSTTR